MADWDVEDAIKSAKEDGDWETNVEATGESGLIHITVKLRDGVPIDLQTTGAGLQQPPKTTTASTIIKPVTYDSLPAIATKNVRPQDVYNVSFFWLRRRFSRIMNVCPLAFFSTKSTHIHTLSLSNNTMILWFIYIVGILSCVNTHRRHHSTKDLG